MHEFATLNGQPSRTLGNSTVRIAVTVQGGHLTARFAAGGREGGGPVLHRAMVERDPAVGNP
ncbi:MAG: hypothetical protein NTU62_13465 [Spirochaetes bacterium]|nr:hypothetical protein [Spirochaetota bacterium]